MHQKGLKMSNFKVSVTMSKNLPTKRMTFSELKNGDRFFQIGIEQIYVKKVINDGCSSYHFAIPVKDLFSSKPYIALFCSNHQVEAFYKPDQVKVGQLSIGEVFDFEGYPFVVTDNNSDKVEAIALDNTFIGRKHHFNGNMFVSKCSYEFNKEDK